MIVLIIISGPALGVRRARAYVHLLSLHSRADAKRVLNIAVFEWRLDDWMVTHPVKGLAKEWLSMNLPAMQAALQAVATSIRSFKSHNPGVTVMLMTDLFAKPSSDIHKRVADLVQRKLLVRACLLRPFSRFDDVDSIFVFDMFGISC